MDSIKKLAQKRLTKKYNKSAVDALSAFIANNPTVQYEDLVRKSLELGHDPSVLIDQALGSVLADRNNLNLGKSSEDLLNELYSDNPMPGDRYVIDPNNIKSKRAKQVAADLGTAEGVAVANRLKSRGTPDFVALRDAKTELEKLTLLPSAGHEFRHTQDWMIRPGFNSIGEFGDQGHHYGPGTYESQELTRVVRDLPADEKVAKEVAKRVKGMPKSNFIRLPGLAPFLGKTAVSAAGGLASLAAEASDAEEEGSSAEQAALLRDIDQRNREKTMLQAVPEQNQQSVKDELEAQRLGLRRSAIEDLLKK